MINPKKWPKKYQYLTLVLIVFLIVFFSPRRGHGIEPFHYNENHGQDLIKGVAIDGLSALFSFGAQQNASQLEIYIQHLL